MVHVKQTSAAPPLLIGSLLSIRIQHEMRHGIIDTPDLVSLGLHYFLRLAHALYCSSGRCLAGVAFSVKHSPESLPAAVPRVDPQDRLQNGLSCACFTDSGQFQGMLMQFVPSWRLNISHKSPSHSFVS